MQDKVGTQRVKGSNTFHCIHKKGILKGKKIIYARFYCDIQLQKDEINRTRLTVGANLLEHEEITSTESAKLETMKLNLNSTISTKDTKHHRNT